MDRETIISWLPVAAFILTLFGMLGGFFAWLVSRLDKRFEALGARFDGVAGQFDSVGRALESIRGDIQDLRKEVRGLSERLARLEGSFEQEERILRLVKNRGE